MSSRTLYDSIYNNNIAKIESGDIAVDDYLVGNRIDSRRGISLIIPILPLPDTYSQVVSSLQKIDPAQYYYPISDLHVTIFDFIQARENFTWNEELEKTFTAASMEALHTIEEFPLTFEGIVFSNAAGIIQGYDNDILVGIREKIREFLKKNGIRNDERYASESAHITFARFADRLSKPEKLCTFIDENRETKIGRVKVTEIELVEHDWYNRVSTKRIIHKIGVTATAR